MKPLCPNCEKTNCSCVRIRLSNKTELDKMGNPMYIDYKDVPGFDELQNHDLKKADSESKPDWCAAAVEHHKDCLVPNLRLTIEQCHEIIVERCQEILDLKAKIAKLEDDKASLQMDVTTRQCRKVRLAHH